MGAGAWKQESMMILPDTHTHTRWSDGVGEIEANVRRAAELGLPAIACTDHMALQSPPPGLARPEDAPPGRQTTWHMAWQDLPNYIAEVERARAAYPQVEVLVALEFDYWPGVEPVIEELSRVYPWDLRLGSVHYVGDFGIDSDEEIPRWERSDPDAIWEAYFARLTEAASSGLFDLIGHADLVKKFGFLPRRDPGPWYEAFLSAAAASGVAIELNTAGLRKPCAEIYPGLMLLRAARAHGVPVAFGSDAHQASQVAAGFDAAVALARSAGYEEYVRFRPGRQREVCPLPDVL